ncbi:MAG: MerR family transcriptional regulator [Pyrinomonadaceae bacterium]
MALTATVIPEKIYFKIGEVCDIVGVQPHVLRYWETEFSMLSPQKNRSGQRSYRRRDVEIALRIKELLYDDMYTIAGARKKLQAETREATRLKIVPPSEAGETTAASSASTDDSAVSLFDEEVGDIELPHEPDGDDGRSLTADQRQAVRRLANDLLELRNMLAQRPGDRDER